MIVLETDRLVVRTFQPDDWKDLQEYVTQPEVTRYDHEYPHSDEDLRNLVRFFADNEGFWAVCLKDTGKMIGHVVCVRQEPRESRTWHIGFVFNPAFYGNGYATESCQRVLRRVFADEGARRVESACATANAPSWRLLERLGLRREADHGDYYVYAIGEDEWAVSLTGSVPRV